MYKHVVVTPRTMWGKKRYETSVIGREERGEKDEKWYFNKLLISVFF